MSDGVKLDEDTISLSSVEELAPELPVRSLLTLATAIFSSALSITFLFPFLGFMVEDFGYDHQDIGKYAGWIGSAMFFGRIFSGIFLGYLADRYGRRPFLIGCVFVTCVSVLAFGFSMNIYWAIGCRLLLGLFETISNAKAAVGELSKGNQARGMSVISGSYGAGLVVGPAIGGLLSNLYLKVDFLKGTIFEEFPYLAPCMVVSSLCLISTVLLFFFLPETRVMKEEDDCSSQGEKKCEFPLFKAFKFVSTQRKVVLAISLYCTYSFTVIAANELYSVWALTRVADGGLAWNSQNIGISLTVAGIALVLWQLFIFTKLSQYFGSLKLAKIACFILVISTSTFPFLNLALVNDILVWTLVLTFIILQSVISSCGFTSLFILINNSIEVKHIGLVNGLSGTCTSFFRFLAPLICGYIYSWSLTEGNIFPFDHHFVFLLLGASNFISLAILYFLPSDIDRPVVEENEDVMLLEVSHDSL